MRLGQHRLHGFSKVKWGRRCPYRCRECGKTFGVTAADLNRRSSCHDRKKRTLDDHLELPRGYYNFCRPHGSLKFGDVVRTPAMQAGRATRSLSFGDIFVARTARLSLVPVQSGAASHHGLIETARCAA